MRRNFVIFFIGCFIMCFPLAYCEENVSDKISAQSFPGISNRMPFFEKRINSDKFEVRQRVLWDLQVSYGQPDKEYVSFLKLMFKDPDWRIRGMAVMELYNMFVDIPVDELPEVFSGYGPEAKINRNSEETVPLLISQFKRGSTDAGYAAYALGILKAKEAIPVLLGLSEEEKNPFVIYSVARALLLMGKNDEAIKMSLRIGGSDAHYNISACLILAQIDKKAGIAKLIDYYGTIESSTVPNDQARLEGLRRTLSVLTGEYFCTSKEAREWLNKKGNIKDQPAGKDKS